MGLIYDTQHDGIECRYPDAECCVFIVTLSVIMLSFVMLSVIMPSVVMLSVVMLSVIILGVVAPIEVPVS